MSSQIASLFAELGFRVSTKGLKEFEEGLNRATRRTVSQGDASTKAGAATDRATNKTRKVQNELAREIRANYAKVRTDRKQAVADIRRINDELAKGNLKGDQKRELVEARSRTQQRLEDLEKQEKAAQDRLQKQAEAKARQTEQARLRETRKRLAEQKRIENQVHRQKLKQQSIEERRDYESWRKRGELARQERDRERRDHQQRMREANRYNRVRNGRMSYRGAREYGRAFIPGIGGAFAAMQSTGAYQNYQGMEASLTMATGSKQQANEELDFLTDMAKRLGLFVGDLGMNFSRLAAATKGSGLEGQGTRDIFEAVSSYARVLNLAPDDQKGVFRALVQMQSKGKIYAEEMNQQLTY